MADEQLANVGHAQLRQQHIHQSAVAMFRRPQRIKIRGMIGCDCGPRAPMFRPCHQLAQGGITLWQKMRVFAGQSAHIAAAGLAKVDTLIGNGIDQDKVHLLTQDRSAIDTACLDNRFNQIVVF
jgi:hypothetical protein